MTAPMKKIPFHIRGDYAFAVGRGGRFISPSSAGSTPSARPARRR